MTENTSIDDVYAALTKRFAKAWDEGYARGVTDTEAGGLESPPENPWRLWKTLPDKTLPDEPVTQYADEDRQKQEEGYAQLARDYRDEEREQKRRRGRDVSEMPDLPSSSYQGGYHTGGCHS